VRAILLLVLVVAGCSRPPDPPVRGAGHHYPHLVGQRYRTKVDLYLFGSEDTERQYVGLNDGRLRTQPSVLPAAVAREHVGRTFGDLKIADVVPAGAELTILSETHEVTAASGIRDKDGYPMGFICRLRYDGKQIEPVMAEFIQAAARAPHQTPNQRIDEAIAARVE
jgi:hypothetical protein